MTEEERKTTFQMYICEALRLYKVDAIENGTPIDMKLVEMFIGVIKNDHNLSWWEWIQEEGTSLKKVLYEKL